jgi:hypothetical protein
MFPTPLLLKANVDTSSRIEVDGELDSDGE